MRADIDPARELAGLMAALQSSWHHGDAGGLQPAEGAASPLLDLGDADGFIGWLHAHGFEPEHTRFVLVLDQMEEWLQGPLQPASVTRLCRFLVDVADRGVWLIATLTNAASLLLAKHVELAAAFGVEGRYALGAQHGTSALRAFISEPAKAARLHFEEGLEAEIFAAANHGGADVLPLLELLLTEIYERHDPASRDLRFSDYRAVGGLDGVVSTRAETAYGQCLDVEQAMVPHLLWKLSTAGAIIPSDDAAGSPMHALVAALQRKRLLVEDGAGQGQTGLRAAHEALLRHWSRAVEQRRREEDDIRLWLDLIREAGQWMRSERALIPAGPQLAAAQSLLKRRASDWTAGDAPVIDYVRASLRQRDRRRLVTALALGIPAVVAGGFAAQAGYDYVESLYLTRIRFDGIAVPGPDYAIAAAPYLKHQGISIMARSPASSAVLIRSNIGLYGGEAVDPTSSQYPDTAG